MSNQNGETVEASNEAQSVAPSEATAKPAAQRLVELVLDTGAELWHTPDCEPYLSVKVGGHLEHIALRGQAASQWLRGLCYAVRSGWVPDNGAVVSALEVLQSKAIYSGDEHQVHVRVAGGDGGRIYLDLADKEGRAVEVTPASWSVINDPPVRFRRPAGLRPIPEPRRGGSVMDLQPLVNIDDTDDFRLLVSALLNAFFPTGPYPVVIFGSQHGTAKSTAEKMVRSIIDPSTAPLMSAPRNNHELVIAASNSWVLALDNLNRLPPWLSDAICQLATGGGFRTRQLYSDQDEVIFNVQRPVVLNGIDDVATRPDLLDRAIVLGLPPIADGRRMTEAALWREFEKVQPGVLGALLDVLVVVQRDVEKVKERNLPRMADFARRSIAAAKPLGWKPADFRRAYTDNRRDVDALALESSPVAEGLIKFMEVKGHWCGISAELFTELNNVPHLAERPPGWPKTPKGLSSEITRIEPNLKAEGVEVIRLRRKAGRREIVIRKK